MNILYIAQSLDGFIARKDGSIDWLPQAMDNNFTEFYQTFYQHIDNIVLGKKTYNQITETLSPDTWPYEGKTTYILTHNPLPDDKKIFFVNDFSFLDKIKNQNLWIVGGASISNYFIENNLVDRYIITTIPIILGDGIPLFPYISKDIILEQEEILYSKTGVQVSYLRR